MKTATLERKTASPKPMHPTHLIRRIEKGLPFAELEALRKNLDLPLEQLASKLSISRATLHRRKLRDACRRMNRTSSSVFPGCSSTRPAFLATSKEDEPGLSFRNTVSAA